MKNDELSLEYRQYKFAFDSIVNYHENLVFEKLHEDYKLVSIKEDLNYIHDFQLWLGIGYSNENN